MVLPRKMKIFVALLWLSCLIVIDADGNPYPTGYFIEWECKDAICSDCRTVKGYKTQFGKCVRRMYHFGPPVTYRRVACTDSEYGDSGDVWLGEFHNPHCKGTPTRALSSDICYGNPEAEDPAWPHRKYTCELDPDEEEWDGPHGELR